MQKYLLVERPSQGICVLRINRPDTHNALSRALLEELSLAIEVAERQEAQVLVVASNGSSFCSGADLKERRSLNDAEKYAHNRQINAFAAALAAAPMCTVAAIGGLALGGGLEIALACDLRFASTNAVLGLTESRLAAIPGAGGTQRLPRLIGTARALEMMYSGEPISAAKALEWGLVNDVVSPDELSERVLAFGRIVASRSRHSSAVLKQVVYQGLDSNLSDGLEIERLAIVDILKSSDYLEGITAFGEKRAPNFG